MATLATIIRKFDTAGAVPRRAEMTRPNAYRLRALPNEDIFFHTKRVDNSRLMREPDPRAKSECWSAIGAVCALAAVLITSFVPGIAGITVGSQVEALKQERQRLLNERQGLKIEEARLRGPAHLDQLAKDWNMESPKKDQVVHLDINASEGAVAFNAASEQEE